MNDINMFAQKIKDIDQRASSELIPYFAYYISEECDIESVTGAQIRKCFHDLRIKPYSNVSSYLSRKTKENPPIFIKQRNGYTLSRSAHQYIAKEIGEPVEIRISDDLFSLEILGGCPHYIKQNAKQMMQCFECGLYDATLVMMKKLIETLIIECFEKHRVADEIKDNSGHFYDLSDLIPRFCESTHWNISRNLFSNILLVEKYGELSVRNRRFQAKKADFNELKLELRQVIQEIVLIIDYETK